MMNNKCPRCKGLGYISMILTTKTDRTQSEHIVHCPQTGCENGIINKQAYYKTWNLHLLNSGHSNI